MPHSTHAAHTRQPGKPAQPELMWAETTSGRRLLVDLADARAHELVAAAGDLNPLSTMLWQRALDAHPWDVVVDVGTNYGEMLVDVDLPPAARLIAFEPNPHVRTLTARTFAENGLDVDLRAQAVAAEAGSTTFAIDPSWSGLSSLDAAHASAEHELVEVDVTTLDDVVPDGSFAVKVDVEGFEEAVLAGARAVLSRDVPWVVMLEVLHMPAGLPSVLAERFAVLMLDASTRSLTRVTSDEIEPAIAAQHVYPQDCLLASPTALPLLLG